MPLYLIKARRKVEFVETGEFSIEATNLADARVEGVNALAEGEPIHWDGLKRVKHSPAKIEEIEVLADGNEDIREQFD